jgi:hypothetical protein
VNVRKSKMFQQRRGKLDAVNLVRRMLILVGVAGVGWMLWARRRDKQSERYFLKSSQGPLTTESTQGGRSPRTGTARVVALALGLSFGTYFVFTSPYKGASVWLVWAPLVVASTGTAGAVFAYGLDRWADLPDRQKLRVGRVVFRIGMILALVMLVLVVSTRLPGPVRTNWRHVLLVSFLLVGGLPAAAAMEGVRLLARTDSTDASIGREFAQLVAMRRLLQRLLGAVGSLVALSTLATGAALAFERTLATGSDIGSSATIPPQFTLLFGAAGSLLVAVFYVPAASARRDRGLRLCESVFPVNGANDPEGLLSTAEGSNSLARLLELEHSVINDLQAGVVILAPLLASAATAFLSP